MMLADLANAARESGLTVVEESNWQTNGHGQIRSVQGVICHHTAGPATGENASLNVVKNGRSDLSGPLANLYLSRSGVVHVVAAGLAYHAGVVLDPATQGNSVTIGIEAEATGHDVWPTDQYDAYARLCAALIRHYGLPISQVLGHKEVAAPLGRKPDPNFGMDAFRAHVEDYVHPTIGGDPLMALSDAEQQEILAGVRETVAGMRKIKPGLVLAARSPNSRVKMDDEYGHVMNGEADSADTRVAVLALQTQISTLIALVQKAIATTQP